MKIQDRHLALAGAQFGDEGKGHLVHSLSSSYDIVVRYQGGPNAGHSLEDNGRRIVVHQVPSGIIMPNITSVIAAGVVLDPGRLFEEISMLRSNDISVDQNLLISDQAAIIFPHHQELERLLELAPSVLSKTAQAVGTTGRGIGPAYAFECLRTVAIRIIDLLDASRLRDQLMLVIPQANALCQGMAELLQQPFTPFRVDDLIDQYAAYGKLLEPHVCNTLRFLFDQANAGRAIFFEGANGQFLSKKHGTWPFVTTSEPGIGGIFDGSGFPVTRVPNRLLIVKAYTTRVGNGPFPTELMDETAAKIREDGHEYGSTTKRPRRIGWFDGVLVNQSVEMNHPTGMALTLLDVLSGHPRLKIAKRYDLKGHATSFTSDSQALAQVTPDYIELPGWNEDITGCRRFDDLPRAARRYVEVIEEIAGTPAIFIGVGPDRAALIDRRQELGGVQSEWWAHR